MYKYKVLPFKLTNRLVTYQRYINNVLFNYLDDFCTAYFNNIIIYFDNKLEYKTYIKKVLERLQNARLQVDLKKCKFRVKYTKYLKFIVSTNSIKVDLKKVKVI